MKILQVNKLYYPHIGGIETVIQNMAEGLKDRTNMQVLVCQEKGKTREEKINGVNVTRCGSLGMFFSMPVHLSRSSAAAERIFQITQPAAADDPHGPATDPQCRRLGGPL